MINKTILNQGGLKLGLFLSKSICEKLEGDIKVESEIGRGTEVTFKIKIN